VAYEILHYQTPDGRSVFQEWFVRQRDTTAKRAIVLRLHRLEAGNFGDHAFCPDGVWELRIDVGPGYRIYYAVARREIVILLCAGDKRSQAADIIRACAYWRAFQGSSDNEG